MTVSTLDELDALSLAGERIAIEWGWLANDWLDQECKTSGEPFGRSALTYALTELGERYSNCFSSPESARSTMADRMRVSRFFTRERVAELPGTPTYHQLRAVYVGGDWPGADEAKTMELVRWCLDNSQDKHWPSVEKIRERRKGKEKSKTPWEALVKAAYRVVANEVDKMRVEAAAIVIGRDNAEKGEWDDRS